MGTEMFDLTIEQIVKKYPDVKNTFIHNGFPEFADDDLLSEIGKFLKLRTALRSKNINEELFLNLLQDTIGESIQFRSMAAKSQPASNVNVLALLPCPLKIPLQTEICNFIEALQQKNNQTISYLIESHYDNQLNYSDFVQYFEDEAELPDVIFTAGYNFYHKNFLDRFVSTGVFAKISSQHTDPRLSAATADQDGHFRIIALNILVMVVDRKRLGNLPVPETWADILKPEYEKKVVIRGHDNYFCDVVQLNFYKEFGDQGILDLARSVRYGLHPAQMVKELGTGQTDIPPIHIMPYFFAKTVNQSAATIIWPKDGALAYPISLLVKSDKLQQYKEVVDFISGPEVARICADAYFPALHPAVEYTLPPDAKFKWVGWDYIKKHDIEVLVDEVNEKFNHAYQGGR